MKKFLYITFFFLLCNIVQAQEDSKTKQSLYFGYGLFMNYNLYCWYQKPTTISPSSTSSGQVLNVLPGLGFNFWLGDVDHWIVSLEGGLEFTPFALDLNGYKGFGALSFPVLAKIQFPISKQQSLWLMLHAGLGAQFLKTDIFDRPSSLQNKLNPFFVSMVSEVGLHVSAVGYKRQHIREVEFFVRAGAAPFGTISFNTGLRLTFWNRL